MANYVKYGPNAALCRGVVEEFEFYQFQFAPRFFNEIQTIEPYTFDALPEDMPEWSKKFVENAHKLGVRVAPQKIKTGTSTGSIRKK